MSPQPDNVPSTSNEMALEPEASTLDMDPDVSPQESPRFPIGMVTNEKATNNVVQDKSEEESLPKRKEEAKELEHQSSERLEVVEVLELITEFSEVPSTSDDTPRRDLPMNLDNRTHQEPPSLVVDTFKVPSFITSTSGVTVSLCNPEVWRELYPQNEMIVKTKLGRLLFPRLDYEVKGLKSKRMYKMYMHFVRADEYKYTFIHGKWEQIPGEPIYPVDRRQHPSGALSGSDWMKQAVSFAHLKLTNNLKSVDKDTVFLQSLHKFCPVITVEEVGTELREEFKLDLAEFFAVTGYMNLATRDLKMTYNRRANKWDVIYGKSKKRAIDEDKSESEKEIVSKKQKTVSPPTSKIQKPKRSSNPNNLKQLGGSNAHRVEPVTRAHPKCVMKKKVKEEMEESEGTIKPDSCAVAPVSSAKNNIVFSSLFNPMSQLVHLPPHFPFYSLVQAHYQPHFHSSLTHHHPVQPYPQSRPQFTPQPPPSYEHSHQPDLSISSALASTRILFESE